MQARPRTQVSIMALCKFKSWGQVLALRQVSVQVFLLSFDSKALTPDIYTLNTAYKPLYRATTDVTNLLVAMGRYEVCLMQLTVTGRYV